MSNDTVVSLAAPALAPDPLTELVRSGARRLVEAAVRAELEEHLSAFGHERLPGGRLPERKILTGLGEVDVRAPKARSRSSSPEPFPSSVAPPTPGRRVGGRAVQRSSRLTPRRARPPAPGRR